MRPRVLSTTIVAMLALGCGKRNALPPPDDPEPAPTGPIDDAPDPVPADDPLADLGSDGTEAEPEAPRPDPIEVTLVGVLTKEKDGSTELMVGADPRFTFYMDIESVEPQTPYLSTGPHVVLIHSPNRTFRRPIPKRGTRLTFKLSIFPEDPDDPHDETFYAELWVAE